MASTNKLWRQLLGVEGIVVENWSMAELDDALCISVRPMKRGRRRCAHCRRRCPTYDTSQDYRRWRGLDLGCTKVYLEARVVRVSCPEHGVAPAEVPWARPGSRLTRDFEDQCAWLCTQTSRTAVTTLMRVSWRTVGRIIDRVSTEQLRGVDLLAGVRRIGIDELSYRKHHKYVTAVVDLDSKRLIWMAPGRNKETVSAFFDDLGEERCKALEIVAADAAQWIDGVVRERAPNAVRCMDPFHVVQWVTDALDQVRRAVWNDLRQSSDQADQAKPLKDARWALWKNPENLLPSQRATLAWVESVNRPLYRAYLLKETLRSVFHAPSVDEAKKRLDGWLAWACRCRIPAFVKVSRTVRRQRERIEAALEHGVSNALAEGRNTQLRVIHRMAFGFHDVNAFIGLAMLKLGGICPGLPGRK